MFTRLIHHVEFYYMPSTIRVFIAETIPAQVFATFHLLIRFMIPDGNVTFYEGKVYMGVASRPFAFCAPTNAWCRYETVVEERVLADLAKNF